MIQYLPTKINTDFATNIWFSFWGSLPFFGYQPKRLFFYISLLFAKSICVATLQRVRLLLFLLTFCDKKTPSTKKIEDVYKNFEHNNQNKGYTN